LLNDRTEIDTLGCRNRLRLYRWEAGDTVRKVSDNLVCKAVLSGRVEVEFSGNSNATDTHNPQQRSI